MTNNAETVKRTAGHTGNIYPRLPNMQEAADAAATLQRCNGHDLDVWSDGEWPADADEFLRPIASRNQREPNESSTKGRDILDALKTVEQTFPGAFWVLAKGITRADEPMFGFQVLFGTDEILAEGEGDTEIEAIFAALALAGERE